MTRTALMDLDASSDGEVLDLESTGMVDVEVLNVVASAGTTTGGGGGSSDED